MSLVKKYFPLFLSCISVALYASDSHISQDERIRHNAMREYFLRPYDKREPHNFWDRKYMTGDWGDVRHSMAEVGVTIEGSYVTDLLANVAGGKARGFAYTGSYGLSMRSAIGDSGFHFFGSAAWRTGTNLSERKIDNQFPVSQIFGSETVRLVNLCVFQHLFNERLIIKAGRISGGDDFLCSPLYWQFVNNAFDGNPIAIFFNIPFTAYPAGTWGILVEGRPWKQLSMKFGCYNANSKIQQNKYHGVNFTFASTEGVVWISEWCALINQGFHDRGMPGNYKVGAFYLTGTKHKFLGGKEKGDPGFYFLFDQMILRHGDAKSKRGLTPFVSLFFQPKDRNTFPFFVDGGLVYRGPFEARPNDAASIGVAYGKYSSDLAKSEANLRQLPQHGETVLELNYWIQVNQWFYVMPDFQYIIHPKGTEKYNNAWVIGAQIGLDQW